VRAAVGAPVLAIDDLSQAISPGDSADDHIAALAAVAAIRSPLRDVLLTPEAAAAIAAIPAANKQNDPINEHEIEQSSIQFSPGERGA
jgi:hypothetical protein